MSEETGGPERGHGHSAAGSGGENGLRESPVLGILQFHRHLGMGCIES